MRICALACTVAIAAVPASAQDVTLGVDLLPGHPVYHENEGEAGVVMALTITPDHGKAEIYGKLCEELRVAAGLRPEMKDGLGLEVIFIVPYKGMAVEGYYLPAKGVLESGTLVRGNGVARDEVDGIVARAGIPVSVLDEMDVEHQISCELDAPVWHVRWDDIRQLGADEHPDAVIERAHRRFMAVHQSVVDHNSTKQYAHKARQRAAGG